MTKIFVPRPAWIAAPPITDDELRRHAGWVVRVVNDLPRQGMSSSDRLRILATAIAQDIAQAPESQFADTVRWVLAAIAGTAHGVRDRRNEALLAAPEAGRG